MRLGLGLGLGLGSSAVRLTRAIGAMMHVTNKPTAASTAMNHQSPPEQLIAGSARK